MASLQTGDSVRQRKGANGKRKLSPSPEPSGALAKDDLKIIALAKEDFQIAQKSEWDFKLALVVITVVAFITRFWGIRHPNQVVFDEVHFGKVRILRIIVPSSCVSDLT
jgi:dolichyl-phosphate-mannose-protein mannosyltransferase